MADSSDLRYNVVGIRGFCRIIFQDNSCHRETGESFRQIIVLYTSLNISVCSGRHGVPFSRSNIKYFKPGSSCNPRERKGECEETMNCKLGNIFINFAVNSLKAGDDVKTLQENMGHFSAAFTLDKYGHVVDEMRKASSNRMQKLIESMNM